MSFEFLSLETIQEIARQYGYWAVFLGIALESLGIPLPGETITIVGGFLGGSGELNYWLVLGSAIAGTVLGGTCGYLIGKLGGWALLLRVGGFFRVSEEQLTEVKQQFSENAGRAVFFGRFVAFLRIFAPVYAVQLRRWYSLGISDGDVSVLFWTDCATRAITWLDRKIGDCCSHYRGRSAFYSQVVRVSEI